MTLTHSAPRNSSRYFQTRTYEIVTLGKKFATKHYVDGKLTGTLFSKNKKQARQKGVDHLKNYVNY